MTSPRTRTKLTRLAILVLLTVIGTVVFYGCSVLREESIVSGKQRLILEAARNENQVGIQARPEDSPSNYGFEAERLWGPYNAEKVKKDPAWKYLDLVSGHMPMWTSVDDVHVLAANDR